MIQHPFVPGYTKKKKKKQHLLSQFYTLLMPPIHESKTTQRKFNGRKGVPGDEVLDLPIGIMQDNTQVSWLATRGLSPLPQGPWEQTQQNVLYWGPSPQGLWEQTKQHPLVPRLCWGPNPQGLWEQSQQQLQHWGSHSEDTEENIFWRNTEEHNFWKFRLFQLLCCYYVGD